MADPGADEADLPAAVENQLQEAGAGKKKQEAGPVYKVVGDAKVPVAKAHGKVWKSRRDAALAMSKDHLDACEEAIKYYHNDQMDHRDGRTPRTAGNSSAARRINGLLSETENVVFSNITTLVPALYSKNPQVEFTTFTDKDDDKEFSVMMKHLLNAIINRKSAPGLNFKPKAKKAVVLALLTNAAWGEIGYTFKQDSSETALTQLQDIAKKLADPKADTKTIQELEGQLMALEEQIDILRPAGPFVRIVNPKDLLVDPQSEEPDNSDANWMMRADMLPADYINARYAQKTEDSNTYKSIYEPTHVLGAAEGTETEDLNNFKLFKADQDAAKYGYADTEAFNKAKYVKVWFVWDKVTRRVLMYNDKDWTWPIWVWDDPYHLDTFFPFFKLSFHVSPTMPTSKGETTYYLDQQDAINEINDELRRARLWAKRNVLFDINKINRDDVEAFLKGEDGTARGVNVPEGMKLTDCIFTMVPPSLQYKELFEKDSKFKAIDKITGLTDVLRGAQFKTNTTNQAIDNYNASTNMRIDEKIDAIEDWVGDIGWGVGQLCLQFMESTHVAKLIPAEMASEWRNMDPSELASSYSLACVGGSTQKPTSQAKKKEAMELLQTLGQFASAAPGVVLTTGLKVLSQAFDEIEFTEDDWERLSQEVQMQASRAGAGPGQPAQPGQAQASPGLARGQPTQSGGQPQGQPQQQSQQQQQQGGSPADLIDQLSPKARVAIGHLLVKGMPIKEALVHVQNASRGAQQ